MRAGLSASGSRRASATVPRDTGVTVAPCTIAVTPAPSSAAAQSAGRRTSAVTIVRRSATGAK